VTSSAFKAPLFGFGTPASTSIGTTITTSAKTSIPASLFPTIPATTALSTPLNFLAPTGAVTTSVPISFPTPSTTSTAAAPVPIPFAPPSTADSAPGLRMCWAEESEPNCSSVFHRPSPSRAGPKIQSPAQSLSQSNKLMGAHGLINIIMNSLSN
jgi:hypothetical protein